MQRGRGLILAGEDLASFECGLGGGNECTCGKRCFRQSKQGHDGVEEHNALRELQAIGSRGNVGRRVSQTFPESTPEPHTFQQGGSSLWPLSSYTSAPVPYPSYTGTLKWPDILLLVGIRI